VAFEQVVQGDDAKSAREQHFRNDAADIAGGAGDEDIQRRNLLKIAQ
jgi:hypothetical protein